MYFVKIGQSVLAHIKKNPYENTADASHRAACCAVKTAGRFYKKQLHSHFPILKKKKHLVSLLTCTPAVRAHFCVTLHFPRRLRWSHKDIALSKTGNLLFNPLHNICSKGRKGEEHEPEEKTARKVTDPRSAGEKLKVGTDHACIYTQTCLRQDSSVYFIQKQHCFENYQNPSFQISLNP